MPPRARPISSDAFHGSFDPGVTGRRTGVAPPLKVRRTSNGIESFSDYFASPRKNPSVSPIQSSNKRTNDDLIPQRVRNDRPDMFHEIGERGRKTGISPPKNSMRDENGFEEFENYLIKATEQTNKGIARERRKSMRRKSTNQPLHARKLSVATFVDDGDDDDEFIEESMSLDTPDASALHHQESNSFQSSSGQTNQIHTHHRKTRSGLSDAIDQSIRTPHGSDLIDFDVVPEGPLRSNSHHRSHDEQPMTVQEDDENSNDDGDDDDVQNSGGMPADEYADDSVASDGFDPPPPPPESVEGPEMDNPAGLEDIVEVEEEDDHETSAGPSGHADLSHVNPPERPKPRKRNSNPPPPAGVRRGQRQRFERLAHWRGERLIYGRSMTPDGNQKVIGMVDVVRVPTDPPESFAARRTRRGGTSKIKSESVAPQDIRDNPPLEEGWDSETLPNAIIYNPAKQKDIERAVVCTKQMVTLNVEDQAGLPDSFQFQRVFKHSDFIAGGLMFIPPGGAKPLKPSKDNCYFFTVMEGAVSVHIHRTTFVVAPQGVFWVPRGNVYSIRNISEKTAKLSFAQARRATDAESEPDSDDMDPEQSILQSGLNNPSASTNIPSKAKRRSQPDQSLTYDTNNKPSTKTLKNDKTNKHNSTHKDTGSNSATIGNPSAKRKQKTLGMKQKRSVKQKQKQKAQPVEETGEEEEEQQTEQEQQKEKGLQKQEQEQEEEEEEAQSSS